jgi:NTE family protein
MIAPGPEDLAAFGPNVMDPSRRELVLDTALRTTRTALRRTGSSSEAG